MDYIMHVDLNIPYIQDSNRDPFREFDFYFPLNVSTTRRLICFIHGGAWRSEDKKDHAILAEKLVRHTGLSVAVPNYRLTLPTQDHSVRHPSHAKDILQFLEFLLTWVGPLSMGRAFEPTKLFLMGHSCSAHMLSSIFLDSSAVTPVLTPSLELLHAVQGIIFSEGIYDLDLLCSHFPPYLDWFIADAFGKSETYTAFAVTNYALRQSNIRWLLIHSQGDTLIDKPQMEKMVEHLKSQYGRSADEYICYDTSLTQEHDAILIQHEFVRIVGHFIQKSLT